jgi:hypothetical protein
LVFAIALENTSSLGFFAQFITIQKLEKHYFNFENHLKSSIVFNVIYFLFRSLEHFPFNLETSTFQVSKILDQKELK